MSSFWDQRAEVYGRLHWARDPDLLDWVVRAMVFGGEMLGGGFVDPVFPTSILEVGCGPGSLAFGLAKSGPAASVLGVDWSPAMIRRAEERRLEFEEGDRRRRMTSFVCTEQLPEGPFEAVVARMVLHHTDDPLTSLREWSTRLRPKGVLAIAEGNPPSVAATDWYRRMMEIKEPGRHTFHASDIAALLHEVGCAQVATFERWIEGNSLRNWLDGNVLSEEARAELVEMHEHIADFPNSGGCRAYRMTRTPDGDILMRWRHCVVVGLLE